MFEKIWERYFIKEFFKIFALFLGCFYGLYILIDYSSHTYSIIGGQHKNQWLQIIPYYFYVFSSRMEIIIPIALVIAFVKTVCTLNTRNELVALMAGGISNKELLRPFIFIACMCTLLLYFNEEFVLPHSLENLKKFEYSTKQKRHSTNNIVANHLFLEDGSLLIYQNYDSVEKRFFDVYWIHSIDKIYRMKYLYPLSSPKEGVWVDLFLRQPNGDLLQEQSYPRLDLPQIKFNKDVLQSAIIDLEILSLSNLGKQFFQSSTKERTEKESRVMTTFFWRLAIPLLCILVIIAPAPFCIRYSRNFNVFIIYICGLFGLIAFYMFMDAMQVMAKRQVLHPFWAIGIPFSLVFAFSGWKYRKA